MTSPSPRRRLGRRAAWAVPAVALVAVAGASLLPGSASATDPPKLPPLTAAQLLAAVQSSDAQALSGTVVETARLGLPALPGADSSAALDWQSLVTGSHTARVWVDGPQRQRIALLGQLAESDVVRSGRDVWTYSSQAQAVTHAVLPDPAATPDTAPEVTALTPAVAAQRALQAVDPTTVVSVDQTARVAGRPVYTLVLAPRDARSTVRRVTIAVDSRTKVPLQVRVFGAARTAAFETGFTDVSFATPAASVFRFSPPDGATVTQRDLSALARTQAQDPRDREPGRPEPTVTGTGWTSVLVLPADTASSAGVATNGLLDRLTSTLPNGDRLIHTALVNVLLASDGRVLVGAVSPELLQQAAGS